MQVKLQLTGIFQIYVLIVMVPTRRITTEEYDLVHNKNSNENKNYNDGYGYIFM